MISQVLLAGSVLKCRIDVSLRSASFQRTWKNLRVLVWDFEIGLLGDLFSGAVFEDVVQAGCETFLVGIEIGDDGELDAAEVALFNQDLGTHARVDTRGRAVFEAAAVDVSSSEAEGWETRVDVDPAVVVVGNLQLASILIAVAVGVAHKRSLPL